MSFNTGKKIQEGGVILGALGVIGFIGIIWLMIYGNLSGNLGFPQASSIFGNETIELNDTAQIPSTASGRTDGSLSNVVITNATGGETLTSGNYTISGVTIITTTNAYNGSDVNVSATVHYDSSSDLQTEDVITNMTGGFGTFFEFSGTFFTIAAIVLLIFMLVGLLALVMMIVNVQNQKRSKGFN